MKEILIKCDICKKEIDRTRWEDMIGALYIKHTQSSCNVLKQLNNAEGNFQTVEIKLTNLCYDCQRKTSTAILNMLKDLEKLGEI